MNARETSKIGLDTIWSHSVLSEKVTFTVLSKREEREEEEEEEEYAEECTTVENQLNRLGDFLPQGVIR